VGWVENPPGSKRIVENPVHHDLQVARSPAMRGMPQSEMVSTRSRQFPQDDRSDWQISGDSRMASRQSSVTVVSVACAEHESPHP
jgi:hypothetical protein